MEKITYKPLINHLKADESYYHHLLADHEIKHGRVDGSVITPWMVNIIQPIIIKVCAEDEAKISRVTKAFFKELIKQKSNGNLTLYAEEYKRIWNTLLHCPDLLTTQPTKILNALSSALQTINKYIPEQTNDWIEIMDKVVGFCSSWSEFLHVGRVSSWMVGLAMVREQAYVGFNSLPAAIQNKLDEYFMFDFPIKDVLDKSWSFKGNSVSDSFGGFIGFDQGVFELTPKVYVLDGNVFATDGRNCCALFADICGTTLMREINLTPEYIQTQGQHNDNHKFSNEIKEEFEDVTSVVVIEDSVVYTRKSSYKVFLRSKQV